MHLRQHFASLLSGMGSCSATGLSGDQVPNGRLPSGWLSSGSEAREERKWRMMQAITPLSVAR